MNDTVLNYKTMSLEELQTTHSEMCATAGDLDMEVPPALALDFQTVDQGAAICKSLDAAIAKFRAGIDGAGSGPSSSAPAEGGDDSETEAAPPAPKKARRNKKEKSVEGVAQGEQKGQIATKEPPAPKKSTAEKMAEQKAARLAAKPKPEPGATKEKTTVAKKAVAKKAPAKKAAKGAPTKKADAAKVAAPRAGALDETKTAKWVGVKGENPYRGEKKARYDKLMKGDGKTVKAILSSGVPSETLRNAVKNGIVKLA